MTIATERELDDDLFNRTTLFIGGRWVEPGGDNRLDIVNPATEKVIGSVPEASEADVDRAIEAAVDAFKNSPWRRLSYAERARYLERLAEEIEARADRVAQAYVHDFGGTIRSGQVMAAGAAALVRAHVGYVDRLSDDPERVTVGNLEALLVREPIGPVLGIVPWNTTFYVSVVKMAPALLTGCPIVIKVATESPLGSFVLAEAIEAAGIPEGQVSFLPGRREALGAITKRPEFHYISFTGSTAAGIEIMKDAAENVTALTLELGGKSGGIILDDLDPVEHAPLVFAGTMAQAGQICTTYSRLFVPKAKEAAWRKALAEYYDGLVVGDPSDPATDVGPLVSASHRDKVERYIEIARSEGATVIAGGGRPADLAQGYFVRPTLVADVTSDMRIVREEVFGPVITLQSYETEDDAIAMANDSEYGLAGGIFTLSEERAIPIALRLEAGNISVNLSSGSFQLPFGGYKKSGIGREGGFAGVEELLEWKQVQLKRTPAIDIPRDAARN
ncbi:aldehyde dehydrogenase family protein [Streptomyces sp. SRF1]|uniref:aldehyde dehydrogenase family protein n=1 Tax=Streptomyces sp. SRF1 TaxID=1549642 RepID=UPI0025AF70B7|nr:aldehyde dehydrogenase family protein [Streptomyces sp. SRF1]MDN3059011.1 aldehyde dehydrogenase family protein [Streptomyces sp. SRF1]